MKFIRSILVIGIICGAVLMAGYRLSRSELDASAAVPDRAVAKASLNIQATTIEEVEARGVQPVVDQTATFEDAALGYRVNYPQGWDKVEFSNTAVAFQAPDGVTQVKVEAVGPLSEDGLARFVDRSLGNDKVVSRQLLTVHGVPAERVITFSDVLGGQVTSFYLDGGNSTFVITGFGEQKAIELLARSFTMPQLVAQR